MFNALTKLMYFGCILEGLPFCSDATFQLSMRTCLGAGCTSWRKRGYVCYPCIACLRPRCSFLSLGASACHGEAPCRCLTNDTSSQGSGEPQGTITTSSGPHVTESVGTVSSFELSPVLDFGIGGWVSSACRNFERNLSVLRPQLS